MYTPFYREIHPEGWGACPIGSTGSFRSHICLAIRS